MKIKYPLLVMACLLAGFCHVYAQNNPGQNVITPAVPFLRLAPDARSGAMGDAGVATSPDANAVHFNAAKLAFIEGSFGASVSYTPWLRKLVTNMYLANASGYYKIDDKQAVGLAFTYLTYMDVGPASANFLEYSIGGSYARKLLDKFSFSVGAKYIYSDITATTAIGYTIKPGSTFAGDIGVYYANGVNLLGEVVDFAFGASITNLGGSISYTDKNQRLYIPTTLKFGPAFSYPINEDNTIAFTLDVNKLLVPTLNSTVPQNGSLAKATLGSFTDAPGGFNEELKEFYYASGAEYSYKNIVFLRGGYYSEHRDKSNQKYVTLGTGVRYKVAAFDIAYLITQTRQNPIDDTMRFTLRLDMGGVKM